METEKIITELNFKAVRSSGAGGQNVNKVSSKVVLTFDLNASQALNEQEKAFLAIKLATKLTTENLLILNCDEDRSQLKNKAIVTKRFLDFIEKALIERNKTAPELAQQIAALSEGSYREALLLSLHAEEDWQELVRNWLNAILKTGPIAQAKWVEDIAKLGREKQKQFLRYYNHLLEQAVHVQISGDAFPISEKEKDFALRFNRIADLAKQEAMMKEIDSAIYHLERNANAKILFHALTIKLYHIIQDNIVLLPE